MGYDAGYAAIEAGDPFNPAIAADLARQLMDADDAASIYTDSTNAAVRGRAESRLRDYCSYYGQDPALFSDRL